MADEMIQAQHFLKEVEQAIRVANREVIHQQVPKVTRERILGLAVTVARMRARYLAEALRMTELETGGSYDEDAVATLKIVRERYDEARHAFEALTQAIDRGYVEVST